MNKMIVCMDYTQDGSRTIAEIRYGASNYDTLMHEATVLSGIHDEVYISNFDPNDIDFIKEIVTNSKSID